MSITVTATRTAADGSVSSPYPASETEFAARFERDVTPLLDRLYARLIPVEHVGPGGDGPINTIVKHIYETGKPPNP